MKVTKLLSVCFLSLTPGLFPVAFAQQGQPVAGYQLLTTIPIPDALAGGFDISWVESADARYYLADRGNATVSPPVGPAIDVIDTSTDQLLTTIPLISGSNGILSIPRAHEIWVGLSNSTVTVFNTDNYALKTVISTGGTMRADEMAYDPADQIILVANDRDTPPFISFISRQTQSVLKKLNFDGVAAPNTTGGIEQSVWDPTNQRFYISIPATTANPNGEIDEIDPQSFKVTRSFPTVCKGPAGLVVTTSQRLVTSCGDIVDVATGTVLSTVAGVAGDEIWYNPGDQRVYFGSGTDRISVNVVDVSPGVIATTALATLVVGQILTAPAVSQTTHSVAADSANNQIFVPVTGVGVEVWRNGASLTAFPNPIPVTGTTTLGTTTITWNAPNASYIEVHVGSPSGPEFTHWDNRGSMQTGPWVSDGMTFYLQDVTGGKPLTAANTLATLVVHLQTH